MHNSTQKAISGKPQISLLKVKAKLLWSQWKYKITSHSNNH